MTPARRLGSTPAQRGSLSGETCPDIIELESGDFLVIGESLDFATLDLVKVLHETKARIGYGEHGVIVPRRVLVDARKDIPDE